MLGVTQQVTYLFHIPFGVILAAPLYSESLDISEARRIQKIIDYQDGILFGQSDFLPKKNFDIGHEDKGAQDKGHEMYDPWIDEAITTTSNEGF